MIFKSFISLKHESGFTIELNSTDALKDWIKIAYVEENILKVEHAKKWTDERMETLKEVITYKEKNYDWTFTTNYGGTISNQKVI